jgi:alpha-ketoglutarate-dependent taurine dioxygenase
MNQKPSIKQLTPTRRRVVSLSTEELVKIGRLEPNERLPLVIQPADKDINLIAWASNNREFIEKKLLDHGAILFRDFNVKTVPEFEQFMTAICGQLLEYTYRSTPRSQVNGHVYTSTEYPPDQSIPLHNEMSYARNWPRKISFFCLKAAPQGGETPIADSSQVFERINPEIRERFMEKRLMYVRNYSEGIDLPWQQVFGTTSRSVVEDYCREVGMEFKWKGDGRLRTRQLCQAVVTHPVTGKRIWFNQAHLFHISNLGPEISAWLLAEFEEEDLPRHVFYGDGSRIEQSALAEIRQAYQQEQRTFAWHEQDILMLDNMMVAHGRAPFTGPRRIVVALAHSFTSAN